VGKPGQMVAGVEYLPSQDSLRHSMKGELGWAIGCATGLILAPCQRWRDGLRQCHDGLLSCRVARNFPRGCMWPKIDGNQRSRQNRRLTPIGERSFAPGDSTILWTGELDPCFGGFGVGGV
jgi:hypothetical protein